MKNYIFWCYKRSGGTLLNKYIVSCPHTIILSEISLYGAGWGMNKMRSPRTISSQMANFYNINISPGGFFFELRQVKNICEQENKRLVLRDWPTSYYEKAYLNSKFDVNEYLQHPILREFNRFYMERDRYEVWRSAGYPKHSKFCAPYAEFKKDILNYGFKRIKFSDFKNKHSVIDQYFEADGLPFSPNKKKYLEEKRVLGDTQLKNTMLRNSGSLHFVKNNSIRLKIKRLLAYNHNKNCFK